MTTARSPATATAPPRPRCPARVTTLRPLGTATGPAEATAIAIGEHVTPDLESTRGAPLGVQALLEVFDRDGHAHQFLAVRHWPLRVGRALDNDVVLVDPHVAAQHFSIEPTDDGLMLAVGDTHNGVQFGNRRLRGGERVPIGVASAEPIALVAGRTRLLLPPAAAAARARGRARAGGVADAARGAAPARRTAGHRRAAVSHLPRDRPRRPARAAGSVLLSALVGAAIWCGAWALLSKTFTRHAHFGWHLRVLLFAALGLLANNALPALIAFAMSWPWVTDFAFVGDISVAAAALYFHLLAVEPARHRLLKAVAVTCALVGVGLMLWFNVQRSDMFGDELYMSHLFPPALRIARPVSGDEFVGRLAPLKAALDKKAKEPDRGDDASERERTDDDE